MCVSNPFSTPSEPAPPPAPVVRTTPKLPPKTSRDPSTAINKARDTQRNKARAVAARGGTLVTGAGGLSGAASTQKKTLLGA